MKAEELKGQEEDMKIVYCKDCKHYSYWDAPYTLTSHDCRNKKMWLYQRTPIREEEITDCNKLNSWNKCSGFEPEEKK